MSEVTLAICVLMCASYVFAAPQFSTELHLVDPEYTLNLVEQKEVFANHTLPDDDGTTNWGDQVQNARQDGDSLIFRDLVIWPKISSKNQVMYYDVMSDTPLNITTARFINVGRQRAYCVDLIINDDGINTYYIIPPEKDIRVFVEIYGFQ
ncbi:hypothetical protein HHI36_018646 [Cryptolaemus montrouzieri]|uniref:Uncharacterized protein n=1 Tax=Cryptolaemus montrouzieri TaxID=559131 RepID=A0ABD2P0J8_9CUCU